MSSDSSATAEDDPATSDKVAMITVIYLCRNMTAPPFQKF
jgi:hypothetical protein